MARTERGLGRRCGASEMVVCGGALHEEMRRRRQRLEERGKEVATRSGDAGAAGGGARGGLLEGHVVLFPSEKQAQSTLTEE